MIAIRSLIIISVMLAAGACAMEGPAGVRVPVYGEAVRANIAVQTVNPMAPADRGPLAADGQRAALQQDKYLKDQVETPKEVGTLQGLAGAGGGGGGGGGGAGGAGAAVK